MTTFFQTLEILTGKPPINFFGWKAITLFERRKEREDLFLHSQSLRSHIEPWKFCFFEMAVLASFCFLSVKHLLHVLDLRSLSKVPSINPKWKFLNYKKSNKMKLLAVMFYETKHLHWSIFNFGFWTLPKGMILNCIQFGYSQGQDLDNFHKHNFVMLFRTFTKNEGKSLWNWWNYTHKFH